MFSGSKVITISSLLVALVLQCYNAAIRNCGENIIQRKCEALLIINLISGWGNDNRNSIMMHGDTYTAFSLPCRF